MKKRLATILMWGLFFGSLCCLHFSVHNQISGVETTLEDAIDSVIANVVHIRNNTGQWQGSGVLLAPDILLTARHVAEQGEDFAITLNDGRVYKAERAITSKKYDLGFIKLQPFPAYPCGKKAAEPDLPGCTTVVGSVNDCRLGQTVYAIGSPYGDININSVTAGIVSSLARSLELYGLPKHYGWSATFQTDAAGHPGNSGCPVYTLDGKVRGILVGGFSNAVIYCVPAELVANDCQTIQLMFLMDEYQKEQKERMNWGEYSIFRSKKPMGNEK